jgi:tripartite-type tricarboxylate transporter receptor subunit TctC
VTRLLLALLFAFAASAASAQGYPSKPVRFVVPFQPAGPADIVARLLGQRLSEAWGHQIVVENRPGAGGNVGAVVAARSAPDGYTVMVTSSAVVVNVTLSSRPGYDLDKDFIPVINVASSPNVIAASSEWGAKTLREAIARAKSEKVAYGSPGAGTTPHLSAEYLFRVLSKTDIMHVPYKGGAPAAAAAAAGEVQLVSSALPAMMPFIRSGRIKPLAVTSTQRLAALPDVPTVEEAGYPGFADYTWIGVFVPAGTPANIVSRLHDDIDKALMQADFRERIAAAGFDAVGGTQQGFVQYVREEVTRWGKIVRATGAQVD